MVPTVLVVDDEERNRALVEAWLGQDFRVLQAQDAASAIAVIEAHDVDLVLLDVMMPGESGIDVCRKLKARPKAYLPVLLLTALRDQDDRIAGLAAGADDFLTKPIDRYELRLRVETFVRLRRNELQIREQLDALARLAALKDDLVSLLVHDLRNPLAGLFGWLHVIEADAPAGVREDVGAAIEAASRLKEATEDLLQIHAIEAGALALDRAPIELDHVVREAASAVSGAARNRGVTLELAPTKCRAIADGALLRRALENLVANAIRYAPPGSTVECSARLAHGRCTIEVADRGPGVPDAQKPMLFTKFAAVEPSMRRTRRGFGLGLYLVDLVARAHGGSAVVRDRDGGGTVFAIELPADGAPA